ncbi:metallophosphoesterase [[Enterobacter] lignolyticus]|uniref:Uncharacterized protein n=1 Tax=Enterobacter lignolyticus (strain SCF1) TaxID=701347 RepID=E3G626_ENTLS|nr:metallophosphoesterase [[Enterobacter] lignolyticus]ADO48407.1 hypothetical protein Entcl_2153 [[Enterobacter] lignolyticus SCF1]
MDPKEQNAEANGRGALPPGFLSLQETSFSDPDDEGRPDRMCVCFSDIHCTDGTAGNQSGEAVVWESLFNRIKEACVQHDIKELYLILGGDVVDMIRSAQWTINGVYPWERSRPEFSVTLRNIMQGIIDKHAIKPGHHEPGGFFYWLQQLYADLPHCRCKGKTSQVTHIQTVVLLGNHDKEILADAETLRLFYTRCLGQQVYPMSAEYRRWVGEMYFADKDRYRDADAMPWLPFYWGDRGFRLFVTHGQWRDADNCRRIPPQAAKANRGWKVSDGWRPMTWRSLNYSPFTGPCFGDTVAAGALSGFIYRAKQGLHQIQDLTPEEAQIMRRLERILDELDLYRPTCAAFTRVIEETWRLRAMESSPQGAREAVEKALRDSLYQWLFWDFTLESARPAVRALLKAARLLVRLLRPFDVRVELGFMYCLMRVLALLQDDAPTYREMRRFPAFLQDYRDYGFRLHCEGHTHFPLQEELYFRGEKKRASGKIYSYINFGAWRDQIVTALKRKYRRRGVGRALYVLDLTPDNGGAPDMPRNERRFSCWVEDTLSWSDDMDRL